MEINNNQARNIKKTIDAVINTDIPDLTKLVLLNYKSIDTQKQIQQIKNKLKKCTEFIIEIRKKFDSIAHKQLKNKTVQQKYSIYFSKTLIGYKTIKYPKVFEMNKILENLKANAAKANANKVAENQAKANAIKAANQAKANANQAKENANKVKKAANEQKAANAAVGALSSQARNIQAQIGNNTGLSNNRVNRIRNTLNNISANNMRSAINRQKTD